MAIAFVQSKSIQYTLSGSARTLAFTSNVTAGNLLVVAVSTFTAGITVTVSDNLNGNHTQAGSYAGVGTTRVSLWYFANTAGGACTVTVTPSGSAYVTIAIHEYSGAATSSVLDSTSTNTGTSTSQSSGTVAVNQSGTLVVGAFTSPSTFSSPSAGASYTFREQLPSAAVNQPIMTEDHLGVSSGEAATMSTSGSIGWQAIGASFKPAAPPATTWFPTTIRPTSQVEEVPFVQLPRYAPALWPSSSAPSVTDWIPSRRENRTYAEEQPYYKGFIDHRVLPGQLLPGPPSGPGRGKARPLVPRVPRSFKDSRDWERRLAFHTEIVSSIFNALLGQGVIQQEGADDWLLRSGGFAEARNPGTNDDRSKGVTVGASWVNTLTQRVWFCVDNTQDNAVWRGPF